MSGPDSRPNHLAPLIRPLLLVFGVGGFLTILAPYASGEMPLGWRWLYWTGLMAVGVGASILVERMMASIAKTWPSWAHYLLSSVLIAVPVTAAVWLIQQVQGYSNSLLFLPHLYFLVWVISFAATGLNYLLHRQDKARAADESLTPAGPARALTDKLPPHMRQAELLAMVSEDHYLRVYAQDGEALILMRLSDALAAVEGLDGAQTHRSWWVARKAVASVARGDGRAVLTLSNGVEAPVSRTYSKTLREAGWY